MITVERANEYSSKNAIVGWLAGVAWFAYSSPLATNLQWWGWIALCIGGIFFASLVIGLLIALLAAVATRLMFGDSSAGPHLYSWGAFISPVVAFFSVDPFATLFV